MSRHPIAYTYDADTHCPPCAVERFGRILGGVRSIPADAKDSEGNGLGVIFPWDEWHEPGDGRFTLACGTCSNVIEQCIHGEPTHEPEPVAVGEPCDCPNCIASVLPVLDEAVQA